MICYDLLWSVMICYDQLRFEQKCVIFLPRFLSRLLVVCVTVVVVVCLLSSSMPVCIHSGSFPYSYIFYWAEKEKYIFYEL